MYKLNFKDITFQLSPWFFRVPKYLRYMFSLIKPLNELNDNGNPIQFFEQGNTTNTNYKGLYDSASTYTTGDIVTYEGYPYRNKISISIPEAFDSAKWIKNPYASFYPFTNYITRFLQVDASRIVLEKYLNEIWDPTNEAIVIENNQVIEVKYKYNNTEFSIDNYKYNNWNNSTSYVAGANPDYVLAKDGEVYKANTNNTNDEPPSLNWDLVTIDDEYLYNSADIYDADYIVKIPLLVTMQPDYNNDRFMAILNYFNSAGRTYQGIVLETSATLFTNA